MAVFTPYLIINIALFVIIAYLVIQCYKDGYKRNFKRR